MSNPKDFQTAKDMLDEKKSEVVWRCPRCGWMNQYQHGGSCENCGKSDTSIVTVQAKDVEIVPPNWQTLVDWKSPTNDPKARMLVNAVPEAIKYPRVVCNQGCGRHLYIKDGMPHEQKTGEIHECPVITITRMWEGHYDMIRIQIVQTTPVHSLAEVIENQQKYNRKWDGALHYWKKTKKVPKIRDIEDGKYLEYSCRVSDLREK